MKINNQKHGFHLVDVSPWPIISAFSALMLTFGGVLYMHGYSGGFFLLRFGLEMILFMMFVWWSDVIREGTIEGQHTFVVQRGLRLGMLLFIVSEVMFFFAFFWAFFHSSFNPSHMIGGVWPPAFLEILNPWKIPLLNTILLLSSGASVTWAHHAIVWGSKDNAIIALICTNNYPGQDSSTPPLQKDHSSKPTLYHRTTMNGPFLNSFTIHLPVI